MGFFIVRRSTLKAFNLKRFFAFDVNKFRKAYRCERHFTEREREIIFPMYKENIKEYRMTINEFVKLKKCEASL